MIFVKYTPASAKGNAFFPSVISSFIFSCIFDEVQRAPNFQKMISQIDKKP